MVPAYIVTNNLALLGTVLTENVIAYLQAGISTGPKEVIEYIHLEVRTCAVRIYCQCHADASEAQAYMLVAGVIEKGNVSDRKGNIAIAVGN